ncbi:unnamed protein product [Phytophthora lilii]|uniref:Unnamed protein product n=1 Tax=Phytophthora lilii TaxID=2077276 RepID=A0A9W6U7P8_9STRA|nr:unnamed protein product [Phytophthora lilii]
MAPELLEYKSYDAKADLWSVGIILYEMLVNEHPFLVVDKCHATNHLALRRNIYRYFERYGHVRLPKKVKVSPECEQLVEALLRVDPRKRISFEDFFRAPFLLPPVPTAAGTEADTSGLDNSETKQPLVAEKQPEYEDWATSSDEYVMVENEYEDVGRKVLDGQDLNVDIDDKANHHAKDRLPADTGATIVDGDIEIRDVVIDTSSPRHGKIAGGVVVAPASTGFEGETKMPAREVIPADNWLVGERRQWVTDDNRLEELLGICYKSFSCGSVALFVPTPFGDYIAFHEGCPHYYLSEESIAASKKDDSVGTADSSSASDELPLSQVLTGRTVASDVEENGLHEVLSEQPPTHDSGTPVEHQRISFRSFQISSLALFFLKGGKLPYVAFNEGAPNYYLANESIQAAILGVGSDRTPPAYICGEIIFIDTFQATEFRRRIEGHGAAYVSNPPGAVARHGRVEPDCSYGPHPRVGAVLPAGLQWCEYCTLKVEIGVSRGWNELDRKAALWRAYPGVEYVPSVAATSNSPVSPRKSLDGGSRDKTSYCSARHGGEF